MQYRIYDLLSTGEFVQVSKHKTLVDTINAFDESKHDCIYDDTNRLVHIGLRYILLCSYISIYEKRIDTGYLYAIKNKISTCNLKKLALRYKGFIENIINTDYDWKYKLNKDNLEFHFAEYKLNGYSVNNECVYNRLSDCTRFMNFLSKKDREVCELIVTDGEREYVIYPCNNTINAYLHSTPPEVISMIEAPSDDILNIWFHRALSVVPYAFKASVDEPALYNDGKIEMDKTPLKEASEISLSEYVSSLDEYGAKQMAYTLLTTYLIPSLQGKLKNVDEKFEKVMYCSKEHLKYLEKLIYEQLEQNVVHYEYYLDKYIGTLEDGRNVIIKQKIGYTPHYQLAASNMY